MARDVYRGSIRGAGRAARDLTDAKRGIQRDVVAETRRLAARAEQAVAMAAPVGETGDLAASAEARVNTRTARPTFTVAVGAEHGGFPYLDVTRFGHRKRTIRAKHSRAVRIDSDTGVHVKNDAEGGIVVREVEGYRPARDWVTYADQNIEHEFEAATQRLGRKVERRILR